MPVRSKARFIAEKICYKIRLRKSGQIPLQIGDHRIRLGANSFTDWAVLNEILSGEYAAADFTGAFVLDLGAHKGYFAAYAFSRGAARVVSYEPEPANFGALARAARDDERWEVVNAAVAPSAGVVSLALVGSWSHTIRIEAYPGAATIVVAAVTLEDVLRTIPRDGARTVVKIDIEGAEGETIRSTAGVTWKAVDEALVEVHRWACRPDEIIRTLEGCGFIATSADDSPHLLLHFTR